MRKRIELLEELRSKGLDLTKKYEEPLTNFVEIDKKWLLGFCREETALGNQLILSASLLDRGKFAKDQLLKELPELQKVFDINPSFWFTGNFRYRGFTVCFRVF